MDLLPPKPDQLVAAAGNVAHKVLYGGLADLRPMPRTLIDDGELREVYHYRPSATARQAGDPVLLVTPLAAPAICYDLRRGCSLVEHFVSLGRRTYLVEYGQVSFRNRNLGMEHWVDEVLPQAIREVSAHAGGRPVHVVGWSLGGIFTMLTAADRPDLPIASLTVLGSPVDVKKVPLVAPVRPLLNLTDGRGLLTRSYRALGGIPQPLVNWIFTAASAQKVLTKPVAVLTHLDDSDYLAQLEAVDRFMANMIAYPGRTFGQLYHRFVKGNSLAAGAMELGDRTIELSAITAPVLVFAGATDGIAPVAAVRPAVALLSGAREVRFEIVPGGHLGMLTGRAARASTWRVLDEWIEQWSSSDDDAPATRTTPATRRTTKAGSQKSGTAKKSGTASKKAAAKKTGASKKAAAKKPAAVRKTTTRRAAPKKAAQQTAPEAAPSPDAIGTNPTRRYGSGGSRSLGG
jgi:polyhydroxyalkanoate synthase subunit PhaC